MSAPDPTLMRFSCPAAESPGMPSAQATLYKLVPNADHMPRLRNVVFMRGGGGGVSI